MGFQTSPNRNIFYNKCFLSTKSRYYHEYQVKWLLKIQLCHHMDYIIHYIQLHNYILKQIKKRKQLF